MNKLQTMYIIQYFLVHTQDSHYHEEQINICVYKVITGI